MLLKTYHDIDDTQRTRKLSVALNNFVLLYFYFLSTQINYLTQKGEKKEIYIFKNFK